MEVINISQKTALGLSELVTLADEEIASICRYILQTIVACTSNIIINEKSSSQLHAISTLLLESARVGANPDQLKSILTENGITGSSADVIFDMYTQHQGTLIEHISATGIAAPGMRIPIYLLLIFCSILSLFPFLTHYTAFLARPFSFYPYSIL